MDNHQDLKKNKISVNNCAFHYFFVQISDRILSQKNYFRNETTGQYFCDYFSINTQNFHIHRKNKDFYRFCFQTFDRSFVSNLSLNKTVSSKIYCFNVSFGRSSNSIENLNGSSATGYILTQKKRNILIQSFIQS